MRSARAWPLLALVALPLVAHGQAADPNAAIRTRARALDLEIAAITRSAELDHALVELGHLARKRSKAARVRRLAVDAADEATRANTELHTITARLGLAFPNGMAADDESRISELEERHGAAFDQGFFDEIDSLRREQLGLARELQRETRDEQVLDWATRVQRSIAAGQRAAASDRTSS